MKWRLGAFLRTECLLSPRENGGFDFTMGPVNDEATVMISLDQACIHEQQEKLTPGKI